MICRSCVALDAGLAGAEEAGAGVSHRDDLEGGQRVIERHRHHGLALGVQHHVGVPQQQGVEQLARVAAPAAAAGRHGLAAVMPAADDFHLRGRSFHTPGAALQHGTQQIPAVVGHQLQQRLVHRGQRHFGVGGGLAVGQLGGDGDLGLAAHRVAFLVGLHAHVELVGLGAHADFGHAQPEGRFAQVHQRGGCHVFAALVPEGGPPFTRRLVAPGEEAVPGHFAQPAAQGQHADVHIRAPAFLDLQVDGRVLAVELHHLRLDDAFALDRDQRGGEAEGHAYLELGHLAGLVAFLFGQHVHAVVVFAAEPELALARDVDIAGRLDGVAVLVFRGHDEFDLARLAELGLAQQQAARVALAAADAAEVFDSRSCCRRCRSRPPCVCGWWW
jgi:hypothetical protein